MEVLMSRVTKIKMEKEVGENQQGVYVEEGDAFFFFFSF